jgi:hypothetical protein
MTCAKPRIFDLCVAIALLVPVWAGAAAISWDGGTRTWTNAHLDRGKVPTADSDYQVASGTWLVDL